MRILNAIIKYGFILFFVLTQITVSSPKNSLDELKSKITGNTFPQELLQDYEFYLFNNRIDYVKELEFLQSLNSSFETKYLESLLLFRKNEFKKSFNLLVQQFEKLPEYYSYYDLLVKTASITGNESEIENRIFEKNQSKFITYFNAQRAYNKSHYKNAKKLFSEVLKLDSTSFKPIYMLAYTYRNLGNYETALKYFNILERKLQKRNPLLAKVKIATGSLFYLSGDYQKAKKLYRNGLNVADSTGFNTEEVKALLNLGMILDEEGEIEKARASFDKASKLAKEIGDNELEAICLSEYAVSYTYTGEAVKARKNYEKSFLLFKKLKNKNRLAFTAVNIGNSYLNISNYKSAIKYYKIGLDEAGENIRTKMIALRGLGDVYTNLSDYSKALEYYAESKKIAEQIKDVPSEAEINIGLGVLYYNLDMPEKALEMILEGERKLNESENPYLKLEIDQKIGIIYTSLDSFSLAADYLNKAISLSKKYGDVYSELLSNTFLADIEIKTENISSAKLRLNKTIAATKTIGYNQLLGFQYLLLSDIINNKDKITYINKAKFYAEKSNDFNTLISVHSKLAEIYKQQENYKKAEQYYLSAVKLIDESSQKLLSNADIQIKYFSNYQSIYNSLIDIYLGKGKSQKAFELLEKSRARNTMQNLVSLKFNAFVENEKLLNKYYDIEWNLNSGLYNESELASLKKQFKSVKDSLVKINPAIGKYLTNNNVFSTRNIQNNLGDNQYLISYYIDKDYINIFRISTNDFKTKKLNLSPTELKKIISSISPYYDNKNDNKEIAFNKDLFAFNADGAKVFYDRIVKSIVSDIPQNSLLIFSLPSEMLLIPFELLITESKDDSSPYLLDDKKFLINDYAISYIPSANIWSELQEDKGSNFNTALLIGDPVFDNKNQSVSEMRGLKITDGLFMRNINFSHLEYSKKEIQSIGSLLSNDKIYLSNEATETKFKDNVEDASIIHLSTHSFLYKNNPLILFSNTDTKNDGFLEVGEILQLNLNSDLVVLSSCKSGLGKLDKAEGIIGMQKAFFDAGAKSVVVSLWDVNDKYTFQFMTYFYSFLSNGASKSEALRLAKNKFIKENNSNPYYWAAFTLSGNDMPVKIKLNNNWLNILFFGLFLSIIIVMYAVYLNRKKVKQKV